MKVSALCWNIRIIDYSLPIGLILNAVIVRFEYCTYSDLMEGYKAMELNPDDNKGERSLLTQCQAVADMKFSYVVSCQQYGIHKRSGEARAQDILRLMTKYD